MSAMAGAERAPELTNRLLAFFPQAAVATPRTSP